MFKKLALVWLMAVAAQAAPTPPYEIVRDHVEIDVAADGSYTADREEVYRILDETGVKLLQTRRLHFTHGYETLEVRVAYCLKPDGRRIDVGPADKVQGFGGNLDREYFDRQSLRITYAGLEPQDRVVLVTRFRQLKPWFAGHFDIHALFSRTILASDVSYRLDAPADMPLKIDASGLSGGTIEAPAGKKRWLWHFSNPAIQTQAPDAVSEADFAPHLQVSTFAGYDAVAKAFRDGAAEKGIPTKDITALAQDLTRGVSDPRQQARILYDWVCTNISYVAIELGIGGFVPHAAEDVLQNRFGDCKDRAILLQALLTTKGIDSTPVLINAGDGSYKLPNVASPHAFDHVITYIPAFDLFVDASDAYAPFGVLPFADTGKPVLLAANGTLMQTPSTRAANSSVQVDSRIRVAEDGTGEGQTTLTADGAYGVGLRAWMQSLAKLKDDELLRGILGPGAEGTIDRGDPFSLRDPFVVSVHFRIGGVIALPGPGSLSGELGFRPFSFSSVAAGALPSTRTSDFVCPSFTAAETLSLSLPTKAVFVSAPKSESIDGNEIRLDIQNESVSDTVWTQKTVLRIDHPQTTCSPTYYRRVRDDLKAIKGLVQRQALYREREVRTP